MMTDAQLWYEDLKTFPLHCWRTAQEQKMKIFLISKSSVDYSKTRSCDLIRSLHTYTPFSCPHFNRNQLLQQPTNLPNVQKNLQLSSKYLRLSNSSLIVEILCGQTKASGYVANFFHLQQSSSPPGISCLIWTLWIRFFIGRSSFFSPDCEIE